METQKRLTKEEVDREIMRIKANRPNGREDKLKIQNLQALKGLVIKRSETWEMNQKK